MTLVRFALATLFAIIPLYGTLAVLDPERPPIPPLVPKSLAVVIALVAVAALIAVAPAGLRAARRSWLTFAFVSGGLATMLSAITGFDPLVGLGLGLLVTGYGLAGLALSADPVAARRSVRAFLWSALIAASLALAMVALKRPAAIYAYDNGRAVGSFLNPNELAAYTLVALGCALPLAAASRGRDRLAVAASAALIVALAATFSRWGLLSAVCGLAAYAASMRNRRLFAAAAALAVAGLALNAGLGALHHNPRDTEARAPAWRTGWTTFERFPLLGVGPLAYGKTYDVLRPPAAPGPQTPVAFDPHSLPLAFAADGGLLAVVVLGISAVTLQRRVYREASGAPPPARALALGLAAGLIALYVDCSINTISIVFALGYGAVGLALATLRSPDAA